MREIKFRGKRVDNGEWVYGYYCVVPEVGRKAVPHIQTVKELDYGGITLYETAVHEVDPKTVGQYTGLKDCKGKEIYEGDILELKVYEPGFGYIEWQGIVEFGNPNGGYDWGFQIKPIGDESVNPLILLWVETEMPNVTCVVIGNIYQNPELLEGENG